MCDQAIATNLESIRMNFEAAFGEGGRSARSGGDVPPFSVPGVMRVRIGVRVKVRNLGCAAVGA